MASRSRRALNLMLVSFATAMLLAALLALPSLAQDERGSTVEETREAQTGGITADQQYGAPRSTGNENDKERLRSRDRTTLGPERTNRDPVEGGEESAEPRDQDDPGLRWVFQQRAPEGQLKGLQESPIEDPLAGEVAQLSDEDGNGEVDLITIPRGECTVNEGASITLQDEDGTTADFTDGVNVIISATENEVLAEGPDPNQENESIVPDEVSGGNGELATENLVVSSSERIECSLGATPPEPTGCAQFEGDSTISGTVPAIVNIGASSQSVPIRIVYATSSPDGSLNITVTPRGGGEAIVDETIEGEKRGVLNTELEANTEYQARLVPDSQGYTVVFEGAPGTGEDPCTNPDDLSVPTAPSEDVIDDVDDDDLPDTGGMSLALIGGIVVFCTGLAIRIAAAGRGR